MAQAIRIGSLEIAAVMAVNGNGEDLARLQKLSEGKTSAELDGAIGAIVNVGQGIEPNFKSVLRFLVEKSGDGRDVLRRCVADCSSLAAKLMVNEGFSLEKGVMDFVPAMQKSDFFAICQNGTSEQILSAIQQVDFRLAKKITNEKGQGGLHVAALNPQADMKVFMGYGFDFNSQDSAGVTPFMLLCQHNPAAAAEVLKNKSIKLDFSKKDVDGKSASDYSGHQKLKEFLQKKEVGLEQEKDSVKTYTRQSASTASDIPANSMPNPSASFKAAVIRPVVATQMQVS